MRNDKVAKERKKCLRENIGYDYILEVREEEDFTEYITSTGGDVCRYRVYGDKSDKMMVVAK